MTPFIVRRSVRGEARQVYHRASGLHLGSVAQHPKIGTACDGRWSAWLPDDIGALDEAVGDLGNTMAGACWNLLDPQVMEPPALIRRCGRCASRMPRPPLCSDCGTEEEGMADSRKEYPRWWAHFDAVYALVGGGGSPAQTTEV